MIRVNGNIFSPERFYNGETIYKVPERIIPKSVNDDVNTLELQFEDDSDITKLIFAVKYMKDKQPGIPLVLIMNYIPYSRMDREIPEGSQIFSMKYFAEIINELNFDAVVVLDPHSNVSEELLNNITLRNLTNYVKSAISEFNPDYIFYPDKGANKKYTEVLKDIELPHFYGTKKRDLANKGHIIEDEYELHDAPELEGKRVLIVDDLVSLGGTAFAAGKQLKANGASEVALYISHCENGVFFGKLLDGDETGFRAVDKVYTAGTIPLTKEHERLIIVEEA